MDINIFNPTFGGLLSAIVVSFLLGVIHGITPDEHTWPITFSYAIGNFSTRKGAEAGLVFSLGFTVQRAIMSEAFYFIFNYGLFSIRDFIQSNTFFALVYFLVGLAMGIAGYYVKYGRFYPHLELNRLLRGKKGQFEHKHEDFYKKNVSNKMAIIHGLIAGFGMGAFALIIFTVLAPKMPSPYLGFLPGAIFGIGTMVTQVAIGAVFGTAMRMKKLTEKALQFLARYISSSVLLYGGLVFMFAGLISLIFPQILSLGISTGIGVYNINSIDMGLLLVIVTVGIIGIFSYITGIRLVRKKYLS
ncbi:MAG: hypothetical protein M1348_01060 [Candidatus Parvarchaeota archaeon]|nr:hypothetical protein [Candidatus Parvarchaeota archaeon]MCL5101184.1 hypothetical protein [Candidatus Parvarchaeota archaeon]